MSAHFSDPHWARRELLLACPLLAGLPPAVIDELAAASHLLEFAAEQPLYRAGEPIREALLLATGVVKRTIAMPGGATKLLELCQTPQLLSLGEVFAGTHYASSCTATAAGVIVAVDVRRLRETVSQHREFGERVIRALAARQCAVEFDATGYHYGLTGAQRVLDYLLEQAGERAGLAGETTVALKTSKKLIAARIGMTPESFSRNLRELSETGVIVVEGRNVHIQNAALLDTAGGDSASRLSFSRKRKGTAAEPSARLAAPGALVNRCGRLRVLSQRMAIAWWQGASGVAPQKAQIRLRQLAREFERTLALLDSARLPAELEARRALVGERWADYRLALGDGDSWPTAAERLFALSEAVLEASDALTGRAAQLAGMPAAHYVNVAGRNRMLSQRIVKFFLFQAWPGLPQAISPLLAPSCGEFEDNLRELRESGAALPELAAQLQIVAAQWQKLVRAMCPDLAHSGLARHARVVLGEGDRLLRHLDTTVKLFERLSAAPPAAQ